MEPFPFTAGAMHWPFLRKTTTLKTKSKGLPKIKPIDDANVRTQLVQKEKERNAAKRWSCAHPTQHF